MLSNYFKIAWRNSWRNKTSSIINLSGFAIGIAVAFLLGLWVWDELSFNKSLKNYDRLAQVMQHQNFNGDIGTQSSIPYVMGNELRNRYGSDFKNVSMASWTDGHILSFGEKKISKSGNFFEPQVIDMFSIHMINGSQNALNDEHSIILSASTAGALFGTDEPMGKTIRIDNNLDVKVTGVYEDFPYNTDFNDLGFIAPWQLFIDNNNWPEKTTNPWRNNSFQAIAQLADQADLSKVSTKIKDIRLINISATDTQYRPQVFLQPMSKWHLYSEFNNGVNVGGRIEYVWLFGTIGLLVLLLACINFMNLSTARSEKRAKEVGIRKTIGSRRLQLIVQFFSESFLVVAVAFIIALVLVQLALPVFNEVSGKKMVLPLSNPYFYLTVLVFTLLSGFIAGSYPAFFLSSFKPIKVLKGTVHTGRLASIPRRILVVTQFTVSIMLIIGTIVIYRQIRFAKDRPVGYAREGLITVPVLTDEVHNHFEAVRSELKKSGAITEMAESSSPATGVYEFDGFSWGPGPNSKGEFGWIGVSYDFGKTVGWHLKEGRDFSRAFPSDSTAYVVNEAAIKFTGFKDPIGKIIYDDGVPHHIIGVVENLVMESPYQRASQTIFALWKHRVTNVTVRINPSVGIHKAIGLMKQVFEKYNPSQPFDYHFVDEQYARKFSDEERIGKLSGIFAGFAILISCLGLFGLTSYIAEKRTKEIGLRKVLGASVFNLWKLLLKEFVLLVLLSFLIATPVAYYFMHNWLQNYQYRTELSWWIFALASLGTLILMLITVSYQTIKAATANPVRSLRTE
jgi:putative ABC transport system permease protein